MENFKSALSSVEGISLSNLVYRIFEINQLECRNTHLENYTEYELGNTMKINYSLSENSRKVK